MVFYVKKTQKNNSWVGSYSGRQTTNLNPNVHTVTCTRKTSVIAAEPPNQTLNFHVDIIQMKTEHKRWLLLIKDLF